MAQIKVTGYIDTDDLEPEQVDLSHEMGLSPTGYEEFTKGLLSAGLDDIDFKLEDE